jgi:shikimate dehydrogenase
MQNAAFAATGLPHLYLRYRVSPAALAGALKSAQALRMGGVNLTVPLKETVLPLLDAISPEARRIGAVNVLTFTPGGRILGDNTDGRGFLRALGGRVRVRGAHALIIGAGGSARAVASALAGAGCGRITIANRTRSRGERLAARIAEMGDAATAAVPLHALSRGDLLADADLVVNATSLGLTGARLVIRYAAAPRRCLFIDLVYGARATPFLVGAARARRRALDGGHMLLHQGALAFERWTGQRAPRAAMAGALRAAGLALTEPDAAGSVRPPRPPTR